MFKSIFYSLVLTATAFGGAQYDFCRVKISPCNQEEMTMRLELFTTNIENTVQFYRDVFGFDLMPSSSNAYQPIRKSNVVLGIGSLESLSADHHFNPDKSGIQFGYGVEIVLEVDDVQRAFNKAQSAGIPLETGLVKRPWGLTDFRVVDPNGYYIRVTSKF